MIALIENILLALTDAQFDKVLVMIGELFNALGDGVRAVWEIASPLLTGLVAILLVYYQKKSEARRVLEQEEARAARKTIVAKIEEESKTSQVDRTKIIKDLEANTQISSDAFVAANNFHAKADILAAKIEEVSAKTPAPHADS